MADEPDHGVLAHKLDRLTNDLGDFRREVRETHRQMWARMEEGGKLFAQLTEKVGSLDKVNIDHESRLRTNERQLSRSEGQQGVLAAILRSPVFAWLAGLALAAWAFISNSNGVAK